MVLQQGVRRLYQQQNAEIDDAARVEQVKQMQQILFKDAPYLVTAYSAIGEAVRSDRFACFQPQPDPGGIWLFQYGVHNYLNIRPAEQAGDCDGVDERVGAATGDGPGQVGRPTAPNAADESPSAGASASCVVVVAGLVVALRRRGDVADRE